jgi:hypothetical protein
VRRAEGLVTRRVAGPRVDTPLGRVLACTGGNACDGAQRGTARPADQDDGWRWIQYRPGGRRGPVGDPTGPRPTAARSKARKPRSVPAHSPPLRRPRGPMLILADARASSTPAMRSPTRSIRAPSDPMRTPSGPMTTPAISRTTPSLRTETSAIAMRSPTPTVRSPTTVMTTPTDSIGGRRSQ